MNTLHRNLIDNAFLGMSKDIDDQFYWTDGTPLDYDSWGPGGCNIYNMKNTSILKFIFSFMQSPTIIWDSKVVAR